MLALMIGGIFMTMKQFVITVYSGIVVLLALVIFSFVRIDGMDSRLKEQAAAISALSEQSETAKEDAAGEATPMPEPSTESSVESSTESTAKPSETPKPVVYVVSPIASFAAYTIAQTPFYELPTETNQSAGIMDKETNVTVNGICGNFYYVTLENGQSCYVEQKYVAARASATEPDSAPDGTAYGDEGSDAAGSTGDTLTQTRTN